MLITCFFALCFISGFISISSQRDSRTENFSTGSCARGKRDYEWLDFTRTACSHMMLVRGFGTKNTLLSLLKSYKPLNVRCVTSRLPLMLRCEPSLLKLWVLWWKGWASPALRICCRGSWRRWLQNRALWTAPVQLKVRTDQQRAAENWESSDPNPAHSEQV